VRIGIDFDNTIAGYDDLFLRLARQAELVAATFIGDKTAIRDHIRATRGDEAWQLLQGAAYGREIEGASLIDGVPAFLEAATRSGHEILVVSHKTRKGHGDGADLREAALGWMERRGLLDLPRYGLSHGRIRFGETRAEKLSHIADLGFDLFIDDLAEVFRDPAFPRDVERWLFDPAARHSREACFRPFVSWHAMRDALASETPHG
jgi:hypothetical protein